MVIGPLLYAARTQLLPPPPPGIDQCPATQDIQSTPYTDPDLPPPYGDGYQYTATANGKTWTGQTAATHDDYLAPEYALKPEAIHERNGKLLCDYGGNRVVKNGEVANPYLRLSALK
ncbi:MULTISPECIES: hypothetical protein [unclassified Pseudomonas]|jgi:hypothetical protein|uniref:hypothetical protein n=1 Tax=unclassified Pseudomonas TaxID=196821 RepID=UPI0021153D30|nr:MULTISPECIES: hypothetical protein [unclassified Pseudomonas]